MPYCHLVAHQLLDLCQSFLSQFLAQLLGQCIDAWLRCIVWVGLHTFPALWSVARDWQCRMPLPDRWRLRECRGCDFVLYGWVSLEWRRLLCSLLLVYLQTDIWSHACPVSWTISCSRFGSWLWISHPWDWHLCSYLGCLLASQTCGWLLGGPNASFRSLVHLPKIRWSNVAFSYG